MVVDISYEKYGIARALASKLMAFAFAKQRDTKIHLYQTLNDPAVQEIFIDARPLAFSRLGQK